MSSSPDRASASLASTLLGGAGSAALAVVRHVPTRGMLWAVLGTLAGALAVALSLLLGAVTLDGGAAGMLRGVRLVVPLLLPVIGFIAFGLHGINRGIAYAALAIEAQWGLVAQIVERTFVLVDRQLGARLHDLPLAQAEQVLKDLLRRGLGDDAAPRAGVVGWILGKAHRLLVDKVETCLLSAYRAQASAQRAGGGVDLLKVHARVVDELGAHLREFLLGPLDGQLALLLVLFFGLGIGWYHLGLGVVALVR